MSHLYQCQNCRNMWISDKSISENNSPKKCPRRSQLLEISRCNCKMKLLTTGSSETLSGWAHSMMLGLDYSFKGP